METLLDLNARIEAKRKRNEYGCRNGVHYLMPYRGADENVSMILLLKHFLQRR